jgi:ATP-dependent DNA helicase RecG
VTAVELLESLKLLDEHERIEAKRSSEAGKSVLETVCALANEPGLGGATPEEETARRALLAELPGDLAARVDALGRREEAQIVVVEVCRLRAWRAEELALLLHRNSRHVRNTYLRPLMRDGRLAMTNPDEPNDPQQAYRTVEGSDE